MRIRREFERGDGYVPALGHCVIDGESQLVAHSLIFPIQSQGNCRVAGNSEIADYSTTPGDFDRRFSLCP